MREFITFLKVSCLTTKEERRKKKEQEIIKRIIKKCRKEYEIEKLRRNLMFFKGNSEIKKAILERWNQLYLPKVETAIKTTDKSFVQIVASSDMPEEGICVEKGAEYIEKNIIPSIKTVKEAKAAYAKFDSSPFRLILGAKWKELFLEKMETLQYATQFEEAFHDMHWTKGIEEYITRPEEDLGIYWAKDVAPLFISKWSTVCQNPEDIKILAKSVYESPIGFWVSGKYEKYAQKKN